MKQPRINGRQARWLVYLTPYDFIIHHRPGTQNPADAPSRRPDYFEHAEPRLGAGLARDVLAGRLDTSQSISLPEAGPDLVECQSVSTCSFPSVGDGNSVFQGEVEPEWVGCHSELGVVCPGAELTLVGCQGRDNPPLVGCQLGTDDRKQTRTPERSFIPPEAVLCEAARATRRVNASSPSGGKPGGQWASEITEEAVGLRTPIAAVQVLCATPRAEDSEAGHLIELVRSQVVTRRDARRAVQGEDPLVDGTAQGLIDQILKLQGLDPWCIKLKKELGVTTPLNKDSQTSRYQHYSITHDGLLRYQGRLIVP